MEDLSEYSVEVVEFLSYNQKRASKELKEISIGTDPLPLCVDKSVETNIKSNAETQTGTSTVGNTTVDEKKLGQWLKRICPLIEAELIKGTTAMSDNRLLYSDEDDEKPAIQIYQKILLTAKDGQQGLATWLSIYTNNTPVLVLATSAVHENWCEHVDQNVKVYIPKRMPSSSFVSFQELSSIPIKACLKTLCTNTFDRDIFAGSTISGDLYIWKFISTKSQGITEQLFCETLQHGAVVAFDWPSADRMLTCHANGWVCLWVISKNLLKEGDFLVKNKNHVVSELTSIVSVSSTDFIVGCADGAMLKCANTNMGYLKTEIEIMTMRSHKFGVKSLLKKDIDGRRTIISCDLSGEVFFHDLIDSDNDGPKLTLKIPLPFQNNVVCSKNGEAIFCAGVDGSLEICRIRNGKHFKVQGVLKGKGNMIKDSDNGLWIVTGLYGSDFQIFKLKY